MMLAYAARAEPRRRDIAVPAGEGLEVTLSPSQSVILTIADELGGTRVLRKAGSGSVSVSDAELSVVPEGGSYAYVLWTGTPGQYAVQAYGEFDRTYAIQPVVAGSATVVGTSASIFLVAVEGTIQTGGATLIAGETALVFLQGFEGFVSVGGTVAGEMHTITLVGVEGVVDAGTVQATVTITGTPQSGYTLTAVGSPAGGAYAWQQDAEGDNQFFDLGVTQATYGLTELEAGSQVRVAYTYGGTTVYSTPVGVSLPTPSAFSLGADRFVEPGATTTFSTITVAGIPADIPIPASLLGQGEMRVLDDVGALVADWTTEQVDVQLGYQITIRHVAPSTYGTAETVGLDINGVTDSASVTTHTVTVNSAGGFVEVFNSSGGGIVYDRNLDGVEEGVFTEAEQAAHVGQAPYADLQPSYTANLAILTIDIGVWFFDGDNERLRLHVIASDGTTVLQSWDTNSGWLPDPESPETYDATDDEGGITIRVLASDSNGTTIWEDDFNAGGVQNQPPTVTAKTITFYVPEGQNQPPTVTAKTITFYVPAVSNQPPAVTSKTLNFYVPAAANDAPSVTSKTLTFYVPAGA